MAHTHVPPNCTVIVKGIPPAALPRFQDMVAHELSVRSVFTSKDKGEVYQGTFIAFLNFATSKEAASAECSVAAWMRAHTRGARFSVAVKRIWKAATFAVFVGCLPAGTEAGEIVALMQTYGALDAARPVAYQNEAEGMCFVNFCSYAAAKRVEADARPERRALRLHNALLTANAARNTTFVDALLHDLRAREVGEFDVAHASRIAAEMPKEQWPPKAQDVARILREVTEHFVPDDTRCDTFLAIDVGRSCAPSPRPPRTATPELSPDDKRTFKRRLAVLTDFMHDNCDVLQALFNMLWQRVRAGKTEAAVTLELSQRGVDVAKWVYEWDIAMLCLAITTPSFCEALRQWDAPGDQCYESGKLLSMFEVLVRERVLREDDVEERYSAYLRPARPGPLSAIHAIRLVRNILCHRPGSCVGLSPAAFDVLFELTRAAFASLACVSCEEAEGIAAVVQERSARVYDAAYAGEDVYFDAASSVASSTSSVSDWPASTISSGSCASQPMSRAGVAMWSKSMVLEFFTLKNFPTAGVDAGEIDGAALLELIDSPHAEALFTAPAPDGLGFNRLMYHGRFRSEFRGVC